MRNVLLLLSLMLGLVSWGQEKKKNTDGEERLVQLSGVIVSIDSLDMISYAAVYNVNTKRGVMSDYYGYFSTVTRPGDTLHFSVFGFKTSSYIVPDTLSADRYSMIHVMTPDTLIFEPVDVYPWPSREQFATAFVEMEPYDDALRKAQRQLSGEALAFAAAKLPADGGLTYNYEQQQIQSRLYKQAGLSPANNFLNPAAWNKFVQAWRNGDLQRE